MVEIISGQTSVTTAGTVARFTSAVGGMYHIAPMRGNTGTVFIGYPGSTSLTTANGFELHTSSSPVDMVVSNLNVLYLDAANDGDGVCWIRTYGQVIGVMPPAG